MKWWRIVREMLAWALVAIVITVHMQSRRQCTKQLALARTEAHSIADCVLHEKRDTPILLRSAEDSGPLYEMNPSDADTKQTESSRTGNRAPAISTRA